MQHEVVTEVRYRFYEMSKLTALRFIWPLSEPPRSFLYASKLALEAGCAGSSASRTGSQSCGFQIMQLMKERCFLNLNDASLLESRLFSLRISHGLAHVIAIGGAANFYRGAVGQH